MQKKNWYPEKSSDICKRFSCKYHAPRYGTRYFPYGCDYCYLCGESKTERPDYHRLTPPENGCSLYQAAPRGWHEMRARELRERDKLEAQQASIVSDLYKRGIYVDRNTKEQ